MNTKDTETLESYFKTENEHWNGYAFKMICEVLKRRNFESIETPLQLFSSAIDIFTAQYETPLKAVQTFETETDKEKLSPVQKLFVFEWVWRYVKDSSFEKADIKDIVGLLKSETERLKSEVSKQPEYNKPLTTNIRDMLKELIQKELGQLPETLKGLEPVQRLNILCKLIPYVLPKVESITHDLGEPDGDTDRALFKW